MSDTVRVGVIAGEGAVLRLGETVIVVGATGAGSPKLIEQMTETAASRTGEDRIRELARLALAADDAPPLAVVSFGAEESGEASIFLYGDIDLVTPAGRVCGSDHVLGVTEAAPVDPGFTITRHGEPPPELSPWNDLRGGSVPGGGVVVGRGVEAPAEAEPEAPPAESWDEGDTTEMYIVSDLEPEVDEDAPFESLSLTEGADLSDRSPLPIDGVDTEEPEAAEPAAGPAYEEPVQVLGVYSPRGFFNHPDARYCSRTGVKMGASHTKVLVEGPRPPLGVITIDDGSTLTVQWNTVIGRDPATDDRVQRGDAAPFVVSDEAQSVSRRHALLELVDWDVLISDLGSRNQTYIQAGADQPLRALAGGERTVLKSGTIVHIGNRSFVYNEHHVR